MRVERSLIDSACANFTVAEVADFDATADFTEFERTEIAALQPRVVFCRIPSHQVQAIQRVEDHGYRFAEVSLSLTGRLTGDIDTSRFPYHFERVEAEDALAPALALAGSIFTHDRFSTDPLFGPAVSGARYRAYLRQSFEREDDRVYVMKDDATGEVVSFASIRVEGRKARLLLGGVSSAFVGTGLGVAHDAIGLSTYYAEGIRQIRTAVSAINYPVMNLEMSHFGFRVVESHTVLRKVY
jgi:hypothetical protein